MAFFWRYYMFAPYAALALLLGAFVFRSGLGRRGKVAWSLVLLLCLSKYAVYRLFSPDILFPELPAPVILLWDWAYLGALALAVLSVPCAFWRKPVKAVVLPAVAWGGVLVGLWSGFRVPDVREVELAYPDLPAALDGYRILQISDLHASCAARRWRTQAIVDRANALKPDLVCLTGDYVDGRPEVCAPFLEPILQLKARDGVFAVTGNHEFIDRNNPVDRWRKVYAEWGFRFLSNTCVFPREGLALGGTDDFWNRQKGRAFGPEADVGQAFSAATNGEFRVLMQHQPKAAGRNVREHGVRLQLSGHTHGGFMPGIAALVEKSNKGYLKGLYRIGDGVLYVSNGAGPWQGMPLRFFTPSEITLFTLRRTRF